MSVNLYWKLPLDNMCNVARLKFLQGLLPIGEKFEEVWRKVGKVIDPLHIHNHKVIINYIMIVNILWIGSCCWWVMALDTGHKLEVLAMHCSSSHSFNFCQRPECKIEYNSDKCRALYPQANFMIAEQVICWSRNKCARLSHFFHGNLITL